jgi:two-component system, NarL family, nitrate/nitrite response regulator NarL
VRVLIVEDHTLFAEAIRLTLEANGIAVIDVVSSEQEATQAANGQDFDVALVDLGLPGTDGIEVGRKLLEERSDIKVLAVTALNDSRAVQRALKAGFHGYLTKDIPLSQFVDAIKTALSDQVIIPHRLARAAVGVRSAEEQQAMLLADQLTAREKEVLELLVKGAGGPEIADSLSVSQNTVRTHIQNILTKLQVHSRLEAASFAVRFSIVKVAGDRRYA